MKVRFAGCNSQCFVGGTVCLLLPVAILFSACGNEETAHETPNVAFYAFAEAPDFERLVREREGEIELDDIQHAPLILFDDIVDYRPDIHTLYLTPAGAAKVNSLDVGVSGVPFSLFVGQEHIFTGYFMTVLSSNSRDAVVCLDRKGPGLRGDRIQFQLGYPTPQFFTGQDPRNDPRLLTALRQAGKLR